MPLKIMTSPTCREPSLTRMILWITKLRVGVSRRALPSFFVDSLEPPYPFRRSSKQAPFPYNLVTKTKSSSRPIWRVNAADVLMYGVFGVCWLGEQWFRFRLSGSQGKRLRRLRHGVWAGHWTCVPIFLFWVVSKLRFRAERVGFLWMLTEGPCSHQIQRCFCSAIRSSPAWLLVCAG